MVFMITEYYIFAHVTNILSVFIFFLFVFLSLMYLNFFNICISGMMEDIGLECYLARSPTQDVTLKSMSQT